MWSFYRPFANKKVKKDAEAQFKFYFLACDSIEVLAALHQENNEDKALLELLTQKLISPSTPKHNKSQLAYLVQDYGLDSVKYAPYFQKKSTKKNEYNVALLLPFLTNSKQPNRYSRYLEYYKGIGTLFLCKKQYRSDNNPYFPYFTFLGYGPKKVTFPSFKFVGFTKAQRKYPYISL